MRLSAPTRRPLQHAGGGARGSRRQGVGRAAAVLGGLPRHCARAGRRGLRGCKGRLAPQPCRGGRPTPGGRLLRAAGSEQGRQPRGYQESVLLAGQKAAPRCAAQAGEGVRGWWGGLLQGAGGAARRVAGAEWGWGSQQRPGRPRQQRCWGRRLWQGWRGDTPGSRWLGVECPTAGLPSAVAGNSRAALSYSRAALSNSRAALSGSGGLGRTSQ